MNDDPKKWASGKVDKMIATTIADRSMASGRYATAAPLYEPYVPNAERDYVVRNDEATKFASSIALNNKHIIEAAAGQGLNTDKLSRLNEAAVESVVEKLPFRSTAESQDAFHAQSAEAQNAEVEKAHQTAKFVDRVTYGKGLPRNR